MVTTAMTATTIQASEAATKGLRNTRRITANPAALGPTDMKAVIVVGAPSHTSGTPIGNATAPTWTTNPPTRKTTASSNPGSSGSPVTAAAIPASCVVPVRP